MHFTHLNTSHLTDIETYLSRHMSSSLFLLSNLERAGLEDHGERFQGLWYGAFDEQGALQGVAAHFWNHNILMQCPDATTLRALLDALLAASPRPLDGLIGPWSQLEIATTHLGVALDACAYAQREPLFELATEALRDPFTPDDPTRVRAATLGDLDELSDWMLAFNQKLDPSARLEQARSRMRLSIEAREAWVLVDASSGALLATTQNNASVEDTFQIGGVWTPVDQRGQGFARRVVAGQIEAMRARGFARVMLFTGEDNIPAQRAYTSLGFVHTQDYGLVLGIPGDHS